jgi:hypothetical protein
VAAPGSSGLIDDEAKLLDTRALLAEDVEDPWADDDAGSHAAPTAARTPSAPVLDGTQQQRMLRFHMAPTSRVVFM